jgi:hypothetical protein
MPVAWPKQGTVAMAELVSLVANLEARCVGNDPGRG